MKCCKSCKYRKTRFNGEYTYPYCLMTSTITKKFDRINGSVDNNTYVSCESSIDLCDKEGYYEPNLIQKFKNFFTGE